MEVVGWSSSEKLQDSDMFQIPPRVESWDGAEDEESRYALARSPLQLPLTHNRLASPPQSVRWSLVTLIPQTLFSSP